MLDRAARAALRALGRTSPNPIVGAVLRTTRGELVTARHDRFGGPHAEAAAIAAARDRGLDTAGATVYVTLEPCDHHGKTPACSHALLDAGVAEVVAAAADPNPLARGGFDTLRQAGVRCRFSAASPLADAVSEPFLVNIQHRRPFVLAKWAQTLDGKLATRDADSKWISSPASRRDVHRLRARADVILTGASTVLADDPLLTAREVPLRRAARRVLLDADLAVPASARLFASVAAAPVTVLTTEQAVAAEPERVVRLHSLGVEVHAVPHEPATGPTAAALDLRAALRTLAERYDASNLMLEAGPRLLSAFLAADLIDLARVYVAPTIVGDSKAAAITRRPPTLRMADAQRLALAHVKRFGDDLRLTLRRPQPIVILRPAAHA